MKMVSARLKMLILTVHIKVPVKTMALKMKHGCMEIGSIRLVMVFLAVN